MYEYRKMNRADKSKALKERKHKGYPLHQPPRHEQMVGDYLITAACYEHSRVFQSPSDLSWASNLILDSICNSGALLHAFVFLPNHYHVLAFISALSKLSESIRKAHSRISVNLNRRTQTPGRRIWYRFSDRRIRGEKHMESTIQYIHNNPVKHSYVRSPADWPWSSYQKYHRRMLKEYDLQFYGRGWDDEEL